MAQIKFLIIVLFSITIQAQEFDFSCNTELDGYVTAWFNDAEANGLNHINQGIIKWVHEAPSHYHFNNTNYAGVSVNSCYDGYEIYINQPVWNSVTDIIRKRIIYHEMGHAILKYGHVCNNPLPYNLQPQPGEIAICLTDPPTRPFNYIWNDIMRTDEDCSNDVCTSPVIDNQRYSRYWNQTDYIPLACGTNKGIDIIYD